MASNAKERLAALSDEQRQLLARRLVRGRVSEEPQIARRARPSDPAPLSFAQQRIWFLQQLQPSNTALNVGRPMRLRGPLDVAALTRSLNEMVRRHESLRTIFPVSDGVPVQKVLPFSETEITVVDLRSLPGSARASEAMRQIAAVYHQPWALETGPLVRSTLWRLADDDHVLLLLVHHILADGWAWGIAERELTTLYQAFSAGQPSPLSEPPIQCADFAVWQREWIGGAEFARQLEYWRTQFAHPPKTQLVADPGASGSGVSRLLRLSEDTTAALRALCRRENATLFMGLTAAFAALLSRYTGEEDLAIGSPIANRNRVELEPLIGCFMNPLPLRIDASGDPSLSTLIRRVRDVSLAVYANQDVPFDVLVRELQPDRDPSTPPLFQAMLLLQNWRWEPLSLSATGEIDSAEPPADELSFDDLHTDPVYPVAIEAYERGAYLLCLFQYERAFATMLARAPEHFERLLEGALADPDRPVSTLPLLTADEQRRLLGSPASVAANRPFAHRLFEQQVGRRPDAIAVVGEEASLTYAALNARADGIAARLRARGVAVGERVAILLPRSVDLIASLFGVLKTGAAYVPLDPAYPAERLRFMLADSGARVLVTTQAMFEATADAVTIGLDVEVVRLDADVSAPAAAASSIPRAPQSADEVAYVIYTSGSTGTPKGVQVPHAALGHYTEAAAAAFALTPADRVLQFASISFDTAAEEIFPCLASGATLVLRTQEMIQSAPAFFARCDEWGITVFDLPTAYWHELAGAVEAAEDVVLPAAVRLVILGGERARPDRARAWQARFGCRSRLLNTYGPTEATIVTTMFDVPADPSDPALLDVPIGRPIAHARTYVVDRRLQAQTVGAPGELCIGGVGLARGYLNRPDLTADRFVPDPFSQEPGQRMYRTGDRVRALEDGTLQFLGRLDHQVKLHGYRIELAEIDAALMRLPAIRDAVVVLQEQAGASARLVAYVVARGGSVSALDLRRALRDALPAYMVPSAFVQLDALPLTPSGKIDRDALPAPGGDRDSGEPYAAPETALQRALASIWRELLRVDRVGLDDNFFDLGGHSLLVLQLHSRLGHVTAQPPSVVDLFRYPTIRALAEQLAGTDAEPAESETADRARDRADRQRQAFRRRREAVQAGATE